ncbi:MAG: DUF1461 domain-containing protein [Erysipelotrichales bacterium]|nr:DUF1461 domain-containing protein [Erysipelotrichales bacterium]
MPLTFNNRFYDFMFERLQIHEQTNFDDLEHFRNAKYIMLEYFRNNRDSMQYYFEVNGELRPFFNQFELDHMHDVLVLFNGGRIIFYCSLIFVFLTIIYFFFRRKFINKNFITWFQWTLISIVGIMLFLTVLSIINFEFVFEIFHVLLFEDGTWTFPATSHLIQMLPFEFFFTITMIMLIKLFLYFVIVFVSLHFLKKYFVYKNSLQTIIHE